MLKGKSNLFRSSLLAKFKIVITQREVNNTSYVDPRDALSQDWVVYLEQLIPSCVVLPIPNRLLAVTDWLDCIDPDVIILSNGNDWGSAVYRDTMEQYVVEWAKNKSIPLLGVCRGLQVLNIFAGGKLERDIAVASRIKHVATTHMVRILEGSFSKLTDSTEFMVNSFHNQGVTSNDLADCLVPFAWSTDGLIEGFYRKDKPVLAIQWHPERSNSNEKFDAILLTRFFYEGNFWNGE